jgi:hypothetical protein
MSSGKDFYRRKRTLDAVVRNYYLLPENEKVDFFGMISGYGFSYNDFCKMTAFSQKVKLCFPFQERLRAMRNSLVSPRGEV